MSTLPTRHYNSCGHEAVYDPEADVCHVTVRGYTTSDGRIVERGGLANPDDKIVAKFTLDTSCGKLAGRSADGQPEVGQPIAETFHDALLDRRDLLGAPDFRNKPSNDAERRLFAAAYDAAQKVRNSSTVLGVNKLVFSLNPSLFALVDCFARDKAGAFWLMKLGEPKLHALDLPLAAYVLEAGEYIPANATVRCGVWYLSPSGRPAFTEVPNDRITTRNIVIDRLMSTPF